MPHPGLRLVAGIMRPSGDRARRSKKPSMTTLYSGLFQKRLSAILRLDCASENFRCRTISMVCSHGVTSITAHSCVVCTDMDYACGGLGVFMKPNRDLSVYSGSIQRITRALDS